MEKERLININKAEVLKQTPIFSGSDAEELTKLAGLAVVHRFTPGEFIFYEGDAPDWFYIVCEGRVKILKQSPLGKDVIIAVFSPGEMLGEVAVFQGKPYPASAQAADEVVLLLGIRHQELLPFLAHHPQIALKIISTLGERLKNAHERLKDLATERVEQRLAKVLLMLSSKMGATLPFTRQEIADMAGTTIETTIRIMSQLKKRGIIHSHRGKIIILDETKLKLLTETTLAQDT